MRQKFLTTILLLLSIVAPFAVSAADSFKVKPVNLEPGNPEGTLEFVLVNEQAFYGFQAEVHLPAGLTAVPNGNEGDLDITLSDRASAGKFHVNSNTRADGTIIMGAFSQNGTPFSGNDGVLASMKVKVSEGYTGGNVDVTNIYFIDSQDKDVPFDDTFTKIGVGVTEITLSKTEVELQVGGTETLSGTVAPTYASDKTLKWKSADTTVATVDASGKITAKGLGETTITATCACGHVSSSCTVKVIPTPVTGLEVQDEDHQPLESGALIEVYTHNSYDLTAVVKPANATDKKVTWTSSDEAVATVDANGLIDTHMAGEATITASIAGFSFTAKVVVKDAEVPVTGVSLDQDKAEMKTGATLQLTATVTPTDATDKDVTWTSSDKEVATVTKGLVKALKAGTVTITATANKIKATCVITITDIEVTKVELDQTAVTLMEEETVTLKATVSPKDATDQTVTWSSSDEDVATVTDEGVVTAVSAGKATITATSGKVSATCEITVNAPFVAVETITLDRTTAKVEEGKTVTLKATVRPVGATDKTVTWTSSDETVATVDSKGVVTAVKAGTAVITAKAGEKTATCTVTVTAKVIAVTGITLSQTEATVEVGEPLTLVATVTPDNATDKTVTWSSSDENVATVDQDGKVTTLATGKVTITAEAGDYSAECVVTVSKTTGVALVGFDADAPVKVYNLCGQYVADTVEGLQPGLYIVRQGDEAKKVQIR